MGLILGSWALLGGALLGLGLAVLGLLGQKRRGPLSLYRLWGATWLGFWGAIVALQILQLFVPVRWPVLGFLLIFGGWNLWIEREALLSCWLPVWSARRRALLGALLLAVWFANRAAGPPVGDNGLYHLSMIRWFADMPLVPGLGNLHARLGFNNPSLLWSAALEVGFWRGRSSHLALGLPLLLFGLRLYASTWSLFRLHWDETRYEHLFSALLTAPLVGHLVTLNELRVSGPDTDTAAALALFVGCVALARLACCAYVKTEEFTLDLFLGFTMFTLAMCFKSSAWVFGAFALWSTGSVGRNRIRELGTLGKFPWATVAVCVGALVLPWLIRGIVLTGYPLYPLPAFPLPVDWRMPIAKLANLRAAITDTAVPTVVLELHRRGHALLVAWLWWQATNSVELVILPVLVIAGSLATLLGRRSLPGKAGRQLLGCFSLPCLCGIAIWAFAAPAPRFGYPFLWAGAAAASSVALAPALEGGRGAARAIVLGVVLMVGFLPLAQRLAGWAVVRSPEKMLATVFVTPGPDHGFHPTPRAKLTALRTLSGLVVYVPVEGDQVWDGPLRSTPSFDPNLRLRVQGDLSAGFMSSAGGRETSGDSSERARAKD